jgi:hypothetical protein
MIRHGLSVRSALIRPAANALRVKMPHHIDPKGGFPGWSPRGYAARRMPQWDDACFD